MAALSGNPLLGVDCSWIRVGYRSVTIQHYNVYYPVVTLRIEIIRVVYERMEPERHLALAVRWAGIRTLSSDWPK